MKSEFEELFPEDMKQFREIASKFQKVQMEDAVTLNDLTRDSWLLGCRWSEIQSFARKVAEENNLSKTDLSDWCYQKYRQLQELHITCRSWYRLAVEEAKTNQMIGD